MRTLTKVMAGAVLGLLAGMLLTVTSVRAEEKKAASVQEGKPAPDITLQASLPDGKSKTISLKDLKGKNVILFFYPKAMTPGCTIESCGFRDKVKAFEKLNTVVIGISVDNLTNQQKFTAKESLTFPLLADPEKKVTKEFGALSTRGLASRYTFVIDKNGVVRKIYKTVSPNKHPQEVLDYIKENLSGK
jgi:thioredoxin-dependent peroxiredoxin